MLRELKVTTGEDQEKVHGGIGLSTWSWRLSRSSLSGEYRTGFSRKDV